MNWTGRVFLITGAKRIGASIATEAAIRGADLALTYCHSSREALQTVNAVRGLGRRAMAIHADLREAWTCRRVVEETVREFGRIDVLIAMASIYRATPFAHLSEEQWSESLAVDLSSGFHCALAAARQMQSARFGRILFVADADAAQGRPRRTGHLPHFVAKSAVIALSRALAVEVAASGVLVNTLALGPIAPSEGATDEEISETARGVPVSRWGTPAEVARVGFSVMESDYITGEVVRVDGGRHLL